jgi:hypothetical protein
MLRTGDNSQKHAEELRRGPEQKNISCKLVSFGDTMGD